MDGSNTIDPQALRSYLGRVEELEREKDDIVDAIKEVYAEGKDNGINPKALRMIVADRKRERKDPAAALILRETRDEYEQALGGLRDLPLGRAAVDGRYGAAP